MLFLAGGRPHPLPSRPSPKARRSSRKKVNDPRPPPFFFRNDDDCFGPPTLSQDKNYPFLSSYCVVWVHTRSLCLVSFSSSLSCLSCAFVCPLSPFVQLPRFETEAAAARDTFSPNSNPKAFFPRWKDLHSSDARRRRRRRRARGKNRRSPAKRKEKKECVQRIWATPPPCHPLNLPARVTMTNAATCDFPCSVPPPLLPPTKRRRKMDRLLALSQTRKKSAPV